MRRTIALSCGGVAGGGGPFGAVWSSSIGEIRYGSDRADAATIGFDDAAICDKAARPITDRALPLRRFQAEEAVEGFRPWDAKPDTVPY